VNYSVTKIDPADDDTTYTIQSADRHDLLAEFFYGDAQLWWVLAVANGIKLVPTEFYPDRVLRVPSHNRVFGQILRRRS
jgi:nucleoid-associated protein YgaU